MDTSGFNELDVDVVSLNDDDFEVSKTGDPAVQEGQF
jgi:hypothetical protein